MAAEYVHRMHTVQNTANYHYFIVDLAMDFMVSNHHAVSDYNSLSSWDAIFVVVVAVGLYL